MPCSVSRMIVLGIVGALEEVRVRHPHHRQVLIRPGAARCPTARAPRLAGAHEIPHVVAEDAVVDEQVALRRARPRRRCASPHSRAYGAVVDQRDQRRRRPAPRSARRNTDASLSTRSASSPWPQASWNSTPPTTAPMHDRQLLQAQAGADSLATGSASCDAGDLLRVDLVEEVESPRCDRELRCRSACRCRRWPRSSR